MARAIILPPDAVAGAQTPPGMQHSGFEPDPSGTGILISYAVVFTGPEIPHRFDMATIKVSFLDSDTAQSFRDKQWTALLASATLFGYTVLRNQVIWFPVTVGL